MCFQILGFDVMINHNLVPSLIEVNQMPSFSTDSPLDYKIKQGVINDTLAILNLSVKRRNRIKNQKKMEMQRRLFKGNILQPALNERPGEQSDYNRTATEFLSNLGKSKALSNKEQQALFKDFLRKKKRLQRERQEHFFKGDFELIYPVVSYYEEDRIRERIQQISERNEKKIAKEKPD